MNPLPHLLHVYGMLLQIPATDPWRIQNQPVYAALRNGISMFTGVDVENVQLFCESVSQAGNDNKGII